MGRLVRAFFVLALAAGLAAGLTGGRAHGRTLVVFNVDDTNDRTDETPGDGSCRSGRGTCTLRAAVMEANALQLRLIGGSLPETRDVLIRLRAATYVLSRAPGGRVGTDVDGDLVLVARRGPAADHEGIVTISGQGAAVTTIRSSVHDRVLTAQSRTVLENLTITGGRAGAGGTFDRAGGGVWANNELTLRGVAITGNEALAGGGVASQGPLFVVDSRITDNDGGGLWQVGSRAVLRRTSVAGNTGGAGVHYQQLSGVEGDALTISLSEIADNTFTPVGGGGGGVMVCCGEPLLVNARIEDSTIRGNAGTDGGGIYTDRTLVNLERSLVVGNTGVSAGGALFNAAVFHVRNTTFSGNAGERAGGIYAAGPGDLRAVTFTGNTGGTAASVVTFGGVYPVQAEGTVFGDSGRSCAPGTLFSPGFNVARDSTCGLTGGSDLNGVDPRLGPLADNSGPTRTHALLDGSPAIDHYTGPACPVSDQRYFGRPAGPACDSGAFERNAMLLVPTGPRLPFPRHDVIGGFTLLTPPLLPTALHGDFRPCTPGARLRVGVTGGYYEVGDGQIATHALLVLHRDAKHEVRLGNLLVLLDGQGGRVLALLAPTKGALPLFDLARPAYLTASVRAGLTLTPTAARLLGRLLGVRGFRPGMDCGRLYLSLAIGPKPGPLAPVEPTPPPTVTKPTTTTTTTTTTAQTFTLGAIVDPSGGGSISSDPGGISCPDDCSESYSAGTSVKLKARPADGFEFKEWDGSCGGSDESCTVTLDQNRSVTARFKKTESSKPQCSDGKDNDGDQAIDLQDPQCNGPNDDNEAK